MSEKGQTAQPDKTKDDDQILHASQMATGGQMLDSFEMTDDLTYDWENTWQMTKWFEIPDSEANSLTDQQLAAERHKQFEAAFMVPEPPSISGIADSTTNNSSSSKTTDIEEKYVDDDMSSLSHVSDIKVSNAPEKHEFAKERKEREGNTYDKLYNAALKGELSVVKDILENHNTALVSDENGQTPLYAACIGNHLEIITLLNDCGYDVNHQDNEGKTVLHVAFENHAPDLAKSLMTQFIADTKIRDIHNWTPLHTATDRGYFSYSKELSKKFLHQDVGTEVSWLQLQAACVQENTQDAQLILGSRTDVNHNSSAGYTALHIAVTKGNIDIVTLLLDQDVNVHGVTIDGKTPLHIAVDKGEEIIIQKLLTQKADPNLKDVLGNTSLHLAVRVKQNIKPWRVRVRSSCIRPSQAPYRACSLQTVQGIIGHGADVNAVNNRGQTAL